MAFFIGTDEAGYGPNLGPLTVTGTLWNVPDAESQLYTLLSEIVSQTTSDGLQIADSKALYQSSGKIKTLETNVLAVLYAMTGQVPISWQELLKLATTTAADDLENEAWISGQELTLPLAADVTTIKELGSRFQSACSNADVELLSIHCHPVFPPRFNHGVDEHGNKASFLSSITLSLAAELKKLAEHYDPDSDLRIVCDKHGGRSKYAGMLAQFLTDEFIWVSQERLERSDYSWTESQKDVSVSFVARGESFLPTALASMVSKYVREIFMELWNNFWALHIPDLKPTKGYPQDAKRFKREIAATQESLGIDDHAIWRKR